jgi:tetratricopeptide (TPR) repeat protein
MSDNTTLSASTPIPDASAENAPVAPSVRPRSFEELRQAIADDPTDSQSQYQLARYYHARGALNQALPLYENSARLDPLSAAAQNDLGVLYMQRGDYKSAESALRRAAGLDPFAVNSHYNLGLLLARTGRRKDAEQEFARAQQNASNDSEAQLAANALRGRLSAPMLASYRT